MEVLENLSLLPRAERLKTIREQMSVGWQIYIAAANEKAAAGYYGDDGGTNGEGGRRGRAHSGRVNIIIYIGAF